MVGFGRDSNAHLVHVDDKQHAEAEEYEIDRYESNTERHEILFSFVYILETEVFLHHVLVETTHNDGDECTRDELFEEMVVVAPKIREVEDLELRVGTDGGGHFAERHTEFVFDSKNGEYDSEDEEESLYEVGPNNRFNTTFDGISPDEKD